MNGTYAEFPFDSRKEFNTRKHVWCNINVDGRSYAMNLLPNGKGGHWLHLKKEIRDAINKKEGDEVAIELEQATRPQNIEIPDYLQWLLDNDEHMMKLFNKLHVSGKKFWIEHIEESKNENTKVDRINRFFEYLHKHYTGKV